MKKCVGLVEDLSSVNRNLYFKKQFKDDSLITLIDSIIEFAFIGDEFEKSKSYIVDLYTFFKNIFYYKIKTNCMSDVIDFEQLLNYIRNNKTIKTEFFYIEEVSNTNIIFNVNIKSVDSINNSWLNISINVDSSVTIKSDIIPYISDIKAFIDDGWKLILDDDDPTLLVINDTLYSKYAELTSLLKSNTNTIVVLHLNDYIDTISLIEYKQNNEHYFYKTQSKVIPKTLIADFIKNQL
jgi:hypothetical protein